VSAGSSSAGSSSAGDIVRDHVEQVWDDDVLPSLMDYIAIPCVSVHFDPMWREHGHLDRAVEHIRSWCTARTIVGLQVDVLELPGRTPLILIEVPAFLPAQHSAPDGDTVLLYGHCDKQPEMVGWREDLGPWKPVLEGHKLYGRGGADDGYAAYAALLAIESAQLAGLPHARCVVLIEAAEESGSPDLPVYIEEFSERIGTPSLVVCLDSGCLDDKRLWVTTSLRGLAAGTLRVEVLREGVHSGAASGVVPSTFRIIRQLLDRIEDAETGRVLLPRLHVDIPPDRRAQIEETASEFTIGDHFPWVHDHVQPMETDPVEQLLATTWRPTVSYIGSEGMPDVLMAGNVLRPQTTLQVSVRLPPTCDPDVALAELTEALTSDPPYDATVQFLDGHSGPGWNAPAFAPWLDAALTDASITAFGEPHRAFGEGGSIPFMGMLGERFPEAQFVVTGALGPDSNAHGPNEYLDVPTARRITRCVAHLLHAHAIR
jgi:acetylornithine deacetylase/succinyl-diaminopimelate desuccinylase-like protein